MDRQDLPARLQRFKEGLQRKIQFFENKVQQCSQKWGVSEVFEECLREHRNILARFDAALLTGTGLTPERITRFERFTSGQSLAGDRCECLEDLRLRKWYIWTVIQIISFVKLARAPGSKTTAHVPYASVLSTRKTVEDEMQY